MSGARGKPVSANVEASAETKNNHMGIDIKKLESIVA